MAGALHRIEKVMNFLFEDNYPIIYKTNSFEFNSEGKYVGVNSNHPDAKFHIYKNEEEEDVQLIIKRQLDEHYINEGNLISSRFSTTFGTCLRSYSDLFSI